MILLSFFISILLVKYGIFLPLRRIKVLNRVIPEKEKNLQEMVHLREEYLHLKNQLARFSNKLNSKATNFNLKEFLQESGRKIGINIARMNIQRNTFQIYLREVELEKLIKYLYKLETSNLPFILKKIHLTKGNQHIDAILEILKIEAPSLY